MTPYRNASAACRSWSDDGVHGLLVPPEDPPAMAAAILRLAKDPGLAERVRLAGRERVVREFGSDLSASVLAEQAGRDPSG